MVVDHASPPQCAATDTLSVLISNAGIRTIEPMRWGLIPSWTRDMKGGVSTLPLLHKNHRYSAGLPRHSKHSCEMRQAYSNQISMLGLNVSGGQLGHIGRSA